MMMMMIIIFAEMRQLLQLTAMKLDICFRVFFIFKLVAIAQHSDENSNQTDICVASLHERDRV